jgi:Spy/CpxP family protein refolding chaperone
VKTRLLTLGALLLAATVLSPTPWAAGPQATQSPAPQTQPAPRQPQTRSGDQNRQGQPGNRDASQGLPAPPRGNWFWWKDAKTMQAISITADQSKQIDDLFHTRFPEARAQDTELRKHEKELDRLLRERRVGIDVISVQLDRVEAQRTTLNKTRTLMLYQMYQVLSAEQYVKLIAYWEQIRTGRGGSQK